MSKELSPGEKGRSGTGSRTESWEAWGYFPEGGYPETLRFSRAREFHLYTPEGKRYLDCILGAGSAVLGHNPRGLTQAVKNRLSTGPLVPAPGKEEGKLRQAVRRLFPAVRRVLPVCAEDLPAALFADTPLWRPFERELPGTSLSGAGGGPSATAGSVAAGGGGSTAAAGGDEARRERGSPGGRPQLPAERFLLVPSFPLAPSLLLLCEAAPEAAAPEATPPVAEEAGEDAAMAAGAPGPNPAGVESAGVTEAAAAAAKIAADRARQEDAPARAASVRARQVSPVFLAGVTKALHLLASAYEGEALPRKLTRQERDGWLDPLPTAKVWERRGIYYRYTGAFESYEKLRGALEERGILIPRNPRQPMVCPRIVTSHERSLWEGIYSTL